MREREREREGERESSRFNDRQRQIDRSFALLDLLSAELFGRSTGVDRDLRGMRKRETMPKATVTTRMLLH